MVDNIKKLESNKKELQLSINSFDRPTELLGPVAWSQLILNLLFMEPGTYPSMPDMGIGIENYEFEFLETALSSIRTDITTQQQKYLKDVPLDNVEVTTQQFKGDTILIIKLSFTDKGGNSTSTAIALNAEPTSKRYLEFDISW